MPVATIDPSAFERRELKSLEGAYVMVRPLPYGRKLERRDKATRMFMESEQNSGKKKKDIEKEINRFELETMNKWATLFDFRYCIGEHNLTDVNGAPLDLGSEMTIQVLDPRVGGEIEKILGELNDDSDDDDEAIELFTKQPSLSSSEEPTELIPSTTS